MPRKPDFWHILNLDTSSVTLTFEKGPCPFGRDTSLYKGEHLLCDDGQASGRTFRDQRNIHTTFSNKQKQCGKDSMGL